MWEDGVGGWNVGVWGVGGWNVGGWGEICGRVVCRRVGGLEIGVVTAKLIREATPPYCRSDHNRDIVIQHWFDSNGCIHATGLGKEEEEEEEEEEDEVEVFHGSSSPEVQYWVVDGRGTIVKGLNDQAEACRR